METPHPGSEALLSLDTTSYGCPSIMEREQRNKHATNKIIHNDTFSFTAQFIGVTLLLFMCFLIVISRQTLAREGQCVRNRHVDLSSRLFVLSYMVKF